MARESTFINMTVALLAVSLASAFALGMVYNVTKEPIAKAQIEKQKKALSAVLPAFDNNPLDNVTKVLVGKDSIEVYTATKAGETVGWAVKSFSDKGFSGLVSIMVGYNAQGKIYNTAVLEHRETPGLGDKMDKRKSAWSEQFNNLDPATDDIRVKKDGGKIDAITAATISSRAFCDAVQRSQKALQAMKK